jgi:DNA-binding transcriptional regulator YhcF (GntR family)
MEMEDPKMILGPIVHIYRTNLAYMAKELEEYRVRSGQFDFLLYLYHEDGVSQETLAKFLKVSKATSARAVQSLEKEGYITRQRDEITSGNMIAQGASRGQRSSGVSSYMLYIVVIVLGGGAFVYRKKIKEVIQARKERKSGKTKPEDQNY